MKKCIKDKIIILLESLFEFVFRNKMNEETRQLLTSSQRNYRRNIRESYYNI